MLLLAATALPLQAATLDVKMDLNNLVIQRVVYVVDSADVVQTTEASGVQNVGDSSIFLKSIRTGGVDLTYFNTGVAKVINVNPQLGTTAGVGVYENGADTPSNAGLENYANAVAGTSMDTNIRNYGYHDRLTPPSTDPNVADLDLHFSKALNLDDHLVVSERWGNSSFQLLALAADGQPYENSNILKLGGSGDRDNGYTAHDWNTGFASLGNEPTQAQALTLFSVGKFFENAIGASPGPIYGLRIFNYDEADVKILGVSNNTFADNPDNPLIPEPSTTMAALAGGMALLLKRRRERK